MKEIQGLNDDHARALEMLRSLGNPARLRIVSELAVRDKCATGDIVDVLPLAQSTVSEHLKVLKEAGVVRGTIDSDMCFCLDPDALQWLASFFSGLASCCSVAPEEVAVGASPSKAGRAP